MSSVLTCDPAQPSEEVIKSAVDALLAGEAVILPTETQYGLALRADRPDAPERIDRIKKRIGGQTTALFLARFEQAESFCKVSAKARLLADKFLPGPLTLVLPGLEKQDKVADGFGSLAGFGIRVSSAPLVAAVMSRLDFPVTATSANLSGRMTPTGIDEIKNDFGDMVSLYIDGGAASGRSRIPSTVAAVDNDVIILRHGAIGEAEIRKALTG